MRFSAPFGGGRILFKRGETYIGGAEKNKHESKKLNVGCGTVGKTAVVGLRERSGHTIAMLVARAVLQGIVGNCVVAGSVVMTDEHGGYQGLGESGYSHESVRHSAKEFVNAMAHTNALSRFGLS